MDWSGRVNRQAGAGAYEVLPQNVHTHYMYVDMYVVTVVSVRASAVQEWQKVGPPSAPPAALVRAPLLPHQPVLCGRFFGRKARACQGLPGGRFEARGEIMDGPSAKAHLATPYLRISPAASAHLLHRRYADMPISSSLSPPACLVKPASSSPYMVVHRKKVPVSILHSPFSILHSPFSSPVSSLQSRSSFRFRVPGFQQTTNYFKLKYPT